MSERPLEKKLLKGHSGRDSFLIRNLLSTEGESLDYLLPTLVLLIYIKRCIFVVLSRTIVYLSIVYTLGQVVMAISAIHDITVANKEGTPDNMTFHV